MSSSPLYFRIQLKDVNGQILAQWPHDEKFPVIPPRFTYPNEDYRLPYIIEFYDCMIYTHPLPANIDLNLAIDDAIRHHINQNHRDKSGPQGH